MKMNKKGFTLIELLAVIIILAIIALIATPIVMNVIANAQDGADLRSVESYGKALESAYYQYAVEHNGTYTDAASALTPLAALSGNPVVCDDPEFTPDGKLTLEGCTVGGRTEKTYHYSSDNGVAKD